MTPRELLDEVKSRFIVLFHSDESALIRLLRQALGKFQEKAGIIFKATSETPIFIIPQDFWRIAVFHDARSRYVPSHIDRDSGTIIGNTTAKNSGPYTLFYLIDMRDWDMDKDLPTGCISLVMDYLEALIAIPNTERNRMASASTGLPSSDLPSTQELRSRLIEIETQMEDSKAMLPPICVY